MGKGPQTCKVKIKAQGKGQSRLVWSARRCNLGSKDGRVRAREGSNQAELDEAQD